MLRNGNFMEGWQDMPPAPGFLINQQPNGWHLEWLEPGQPLFDDPNVISKGVPECVHKLHTQLPSHEQLGAPNALILDGDTTYKIFNATTPFGASLSQTVEGLQPGTEATLTVPIQVHLHGETDAFGAESGAWVNDEGHWVNGFAMGDRQWFRHSVSFIVPEDGRAEIVIRVKSKWFRPKDFFFDGITLEAKKATGTPIVDPGKPPVDTGTTPDPTTVSPGEVKTVHIQLPPGLSLRQGTCDTPGTIELNIPPGVEIKVV
ncbi:MAG: hypothetical protein JSV68_04210 [Anaerolineaceae bacterium]|nr:MAG: hypothetical protein JSV68_04210 [Anaerolineaceae bacterium]